MKLKGKKTKAIIVGGLVGGASCAARLRRLYQKTEILIVKRRRYLVNWLPTWTPPRFRLK
jgi:hypothetical protein